MMVARGTIPIQHSQGHASMSTPASVRFQPSRCPHSLTLPAASQARAASAPARCSIGRASPRQMGPIPALFCAWTSWPALACSPHTIRHTTNDPAADCIQISREGLWGPKFPSSRLRCWRLLFPAHGLIASFAGRPASSCLFRSSVHRYYRMSSPTGGQGVGWRYAP